MQDSARKSGKKGHRQDSISGADTSSDVPLQQTTPKKVPFVHRAVFPEKTHRKKGLRAEKFFENVKVVFPPEDAAGRRLRAKDSHIHRERKVWYSSADDH